MSRMPGSYVALLAQVFVGTMALTIFASDARTDEIDKAYVQGVIEGTWTLAEWNVDGTNLQPPEVDGRFSIHGGVVMYFLERRTPGKEIFVSGYGSYDLAETNWSYHYEHFRTLLGTGNDTKVYNEAPWPGIRTFEFRIEGSKLILDDKRDDAMFAFEPGGFAYIENGKTARVWKSVPE